MKMSSLQDILAKVNDAVDVRPDDSPTKAAFKRAALVGVGFEIGSLLAGGGIVGSLPLSFAAAAGAGIVTFFDRSSQRAAESRQQKPSP